MDLTDQTKPCFPPYPPPFHRARSHPCPLRADLRAAARAEMICYGSRLDYPSGRFLLYNGNAYGKDGFGAARLR